MNRLSQRALQDKLPSAMIDSAANTVVLSNIWQETLCQLEGSGKALFELLDSPHRVLQCKALDRGGTGSVYIDLESEVTGNRHEVWVDRGKNDLVHRLVSHIRPKSLGDGEVRVEVSVSEFREVKPGLFFPVRATRCLYGNGVELVRWETSLTEVRISEPPPGGTFTHTYPPGTFVQDLTRNTVYTVSQSGQPERQQAVVFAQPAAPAAGAETFSGEAAPSRTTPFWPAFFFACLLVFGLILVVRARMNSSRPR